MTRLESGYRVEPITPVAVSGYVRLSFLEEGYAFRDEKSPRFRGEWEYFWSMRSRRSAVPDGISPRARVTLLFASQTVGNLVFPLGEGFRGPPP